MNKYLFFLRAYNDTDNIEPAVYFLLADDIQATAHIFYYSIDFDFRANPGLGFLKKVFGSRLTVDWIGYHMGLDPDRLFTGNWQGEAYSFYHRVAPWRRCLDGVRGVSRYRFPATALKSVCRKLLHESGSPELVIFDQNRTDQVSGLLAALRNAGVRRIVSLPVSPLVNINVLRSPRVSTANPAALRRIHDYSGFDAVGIADRHYLESLQRTFSLFGQTSPLEGLGVALGSIRYCPEWLAIREQRALPTGIPAQPDKRKLLFLLSQPTANSNWHAVKSAVNLLKSMSDYHVVIKPHTRRAADEFGVLPQHMAVAPQVESSSLINWSDAVLFWGTSMAIEAYAKNKIVLCADYLNTNRIVYTEYNAGWILRCLDDLHEALVSIAGGRQQLPYTQQDIDRMPFNVVGNGQAEPVPQRYVSFIRAQQRAARDSVTTTLARGIYA